MQHYTRVQNLGYCARQRAPTTNPAAKRNVPQIVKPLWAALRVRDTAISQRPGKNEHERIRLIIKPGNIEARAALGRRLIEDPHLNGV